MFHFYIAQIEKTILFKCIIIIHISDFINLKTDFPTRGTSARMNCTFVNKFICGILVVFINSGTIFTY